MKKLLGILYFLFISFASASPRPYLILVSFDAFRWDYLNRGITPNLESIREKGASALSLRPAFPSKTFPNHLSIATGMYPAHHGIIQNNFYDPFHKTAYRMKDTAVTREARWYLGEAFWETAERQGVISANYFWPGSELKEKSRRSTYSETFEFDRSYEKRVDGVIDWLKLPAEKRPHFITVYFQDTDTYGHRFGPNSPEINESIKRMDGIAGLLMTRLDEIKMRDSVNVIFVSDHGMTEVSPERTINIEKIAGSAHARFYDDGPVMMVQPSGEDPEKLYTLLKKNENHYRVYNREEIPEYYHYSDNPYITPIVVIADLGWTLVTDKGVEWLSQEKGNHGYDNNQTDMQGIFIAEGPAFKSKYKTGTLWNIDIYPLLCSIFKIIPRSNIDGELSRIEFILK
jgi:ectonucleotide pyrophosphatase/phosphodiesterase family member 5